ncbi:MAG: NAD-dependent DNA ligase LigA [Mycoplasma sp.]|nr:NAD-dependent DNA ligase LigA [Mycoplasma sp.]
MNKKVLEEYKELQKKLKKWAHHYYVLNKTLVPDQVYDANYQKLVVLEKQYPQLISSDSITKQIGASVSKKFQKIVHNQPMLSIANAFQKQDLIKFDNHIKKQLNYFNDIGYYLEYKIDGLSISLIYQDGKLLKGITRGNGEIGEDVTNNIFQINDIPKVINYKNKLEVRGEVYMKISSFNLLNKELENKFSNPRNAASGTLRTLDSKIVKKRNLSSFFYQIIDPNQHNLKSQSSVIQFLEKLKFKVNQNNKLVNNIDNIISSIPEYLEKRNQLDYYVDGLVVKVNDLSLYNDIGSTSKYPKWLIAYKFPEEQVTTKLINIFPTVGRTGRITYNAELEPVLLSGSIVKYATLHNCDYVKKIKINVNDFVVLKKAGEIIPKVIKVYKKVNNQNWKENTNCPSCNHILIKKNDGVDQYCINSNCYEKIINSFIHFTSKNAMDIVGLSNSSIRTFYKNNLIKDLADIYLLKNHYQFLVNLENYGTKSVDTLLEEIEKSKIRKLANFIFALGIEHLGYKKSQILTNHFSNLELLKKATYQDFLKVDTFGPKLSESLVNWFNDSKNLELLDKFKNIGLAFEQQKTKKITNNLNNYSFVITGSFEKPRIEYENMIIENGGRVSNTITKKTSYLLLGKNPGSKKEKALKLKIEIITLENLIELIKYGKIKK